MKFELDGTVLEFDIDGYDVNLDGSRNEDFCRTRMVIQSAYFNYYEDSRIMRCSEIDLLFDRVGRLINGRLKKNEHIFLDEPVLEFRLRPSTEDTDIDMFWIVNLRDDNGTVTANHISLLMGRYDVEKLHRYLKSVIQSARDI